VATWLYAFRTTFRISSGVALIPTVISYAYAARYGSEVRKKLTQLIQQVGLNPAADLPSTSFCSDEARLGQLFDVVGDGGWSDVQICGKLTHAAAYHLTRFAPDPGYATAGQTPEDLQSMGVTQRLETRGQSD